MSETVKTKKQKKSWFQGLKAEFYKIIWPDRRFTYKTDNAVCDCIRYFGSDYCTDGLYHSVWCRFPCKIVMEAKVILWQRHTGM